MPRLAKLLSICGVLALAGLLSADPGDKPASENSPGNQPAAEKAVASRRGSASQKKEAAKARQISFTPEREAAVLSFVERNHAELGDLLGHLKANQPKEYERAVRELFRVTERLAGIQQRDPLQYELEVRHWTAQSQVQLLTARLKMSATDDLKVQLREAIGAQADARLAVLEHMRGKAAERLEKMDRDIARLQDDREKVIDKQLELLVRTANDDQAGGKKPGAKGARNKPGKRAGGKRTVD
jgi:hypothetical protein